MKLGKMKFGKSVKAGTDGQPETPLGSRSRKTAGRKVRSQAGSAGGKKGVAGVLAGISGLGKGVMRLKMLRGLNRSIRMKLIAAFLIAVIGLVTLGVVSYNKAANSLEQTASESAMLMMNSRADYLTLLLGNLDNSMTQLFSNKDLQTYLTSEDQMERVAASTGANTLLSAVSLANPIVKNLAVLNEINSIGSPFIENDMAKMSATRMTRAGRVSSSPDRWKG